MSKTREQISRYSAVGLLRAGSDFPHWRRSDHYRGCRGPGGAYRDRTDDLKLAKLALSQLSYGPEPNGPNVRTDHGARWNGGPSRS